MKKLLLTLLLPFMFLNNQCTHVPQKLIDPSMTAIEAEDVTAFISGCGQQVSVGFVYCRKQQGDSTKEHLRFYTPKLLCKTPPCANVKLFLQDGTVLGYDIPNNPGFILVRWSDILGKDTFDIGDRGIMGVIYEYRYLDENELEHTVFTQGEVRLRVINADYVPLHNVSSDAHFVFVRSFGKAQLKMTTAGRASISWK